jgi:hypothetical protein
VQQQQMVLQLVCHLPLLTAAMQSGCPQSTPQADLYRLLLLPVLLLLLL